MGVVRGLSDGESGAIAIMVALFAVVLFGFAALVVDVGNASDVKAQSSTAADAGALAGERELAAWVAAGNLLPDPGLEGVVEAAVNSTFPVSTAAWGSCVDSSMPTGFVPSPTTPCIQYLVPDARTSTTVRVRIPIRHVPSTFGGIFGVGSIAVSPVAAATAGQDPASPCQPCDPRLDLSGQPVSQAQLPDAVRNELPKQSMDVARPLLPPDPTTGCPQAPGLYDSDVKVTVSATDPPCTLPPGLYLFVDSKLEVHGALTNAPVNGTGVTLVFFGTKPKEPLEIDGDLTLVSSPANKPFATGDPLPGVAIVIDQFAPAGATKHRQFDLGSDFNITGSVYALDGDTTWHTDVADCPVTPVSCHIRDDGAPQRIAVTTTAFGDASDGNRVPSVSSDHVVAVPPKPEHLSE